MPRGNNNSNNNSSNNNNNADHLSPSALPKASAAIASPASPPSSAKYEELYPGDTVVLLDVSSNQGRFPKRVGTTGKLTSVPRRGHPKGVNARQWEVSFPDGKFMKFKRTTIARVSKGPQSLAAEPKPATGGREENKQKKQKQQVQDAGASLRTKRKSAASSRSSSSTKNSEESPPSKRVSAESEATELKAESESNTLSIAEQVKASRGRMVSEIDPDLWELLAVKIVHGKGKRCFAVVLSTGNGWIQVKIVDDGSGGPGEWARRETLAKRSHELQVRGLKPGAKLPKAAVPSHTITLSQHSDKTGKQARKSDEAMGRDNRNTPNKEEGASLNTKPVKQTLQLRMGKGTSKTSPTPKKSTPKAKPISTSNLTTELDGIPATESDSAATSGRSTPSIQGGRQASRKEPTSSVKKTPSSSSTSKPAKKVVPQSHGSGAAGGAGFAAGADGLMHCHRHLTSPGMSSSAARKAEDEARQARTRFYIDKQCATFLPNRPNFARWLEQVGLDCATQQAIDQRVAPQPLVRDQTCSQCNGRMEAEDEFCWNLQCPGCPANLDPWDNQAANVRAGADAPTAIAAVAQGPRFEYAYHQYAPVKWVGQRFRFGKPVHTVSKLDVHGVPVLNEKVASPVTEVERTFVEEVEVPVRGEGGSEAPGGDEATKTVRKVVVRRVPKGTCKTVGSDLSYRWSSWIRDEMRDRHPLLDASMSLMAVRTDALPYDKYAALRRKLAAKAGEAKNSSKGPVKQGRRGSRSRAAGSRARSSKSKSARASKRKSK